MLSRRTFISGVAWSTAGASSLGVLDLTRASAIAAELACHPGTAEELACDENFWFEVQQAFTNDRSLVNLNSGGVSPSPNIVQQAMKRHLDYSNTVPPYTMWKVLEPQREPVRERLARNFSCDAEEIALTRNASEGLQICQLGFDLQSGDELLTTTQDYGRMITTFKQRERREGLVLRQFQIPIPAEDPGEIVALFEANITDRTRLILMCHMINITGQILPVRQAAGGMAVLDEFERLDLLKNAAEVGTRLTRELESRVDLHGAIGDVRGCGLFISIEMLKDGATKEPDAALTISLADRLKDKGFLVSYSGKFHNVLKIRPPLVFSHANADDFLGAFDECMGEMGG